MAMNDAVFRRATADAAAGLDADPTEFFCECGAEACDARFMVSLSKYAAVRETQGRYLVLPEHNRGDAVVYTDAEYAVIDTQASASRR